MAVARVVIVPLGTGTTSLSRYVSECVKSIRDSGIKYRLTPMGTILEGSVDEILRITRKIHEIPFENGALRVSTKLEIDERRDSELTMDGKIHSVEGKLNG